MVPLPVPDVTDVNAAGSPPEHIVSSAAISPPSTLLTVTVSTLLNASHATLLSVLIVTLLYFVSSVNPEGASYVAAVADTIVVHVVNGFTDSSQRYVIVPSPVPAANDVNAAGSVHTV